ncbi:hypothetical protein GIX45_26805 [Erwinia sp. CPCC 100877]|nr:hypothetical protein [Erwinia sp. CPCC 100877]
MEAEEVVSNLADYQGQTTDTAPLVLLEVDQQIIGKDEDNIYNFSNKNMLETEKEALFLQADLSDLMLSNTINLYAETTNEQTNVDSSQATEETTSLQETTEASETTTEVSRNPEETAPQASSQTEAAELTIPETSNAQQFPKQARAVQSAGLFPQSERLDFNHSIAGKISGNGEKRYYQIEVPESKIENYFEEYNFYVISDFDSYGTLFDSAGNKLTKNDDGNGNGDFKINYRLGTGVYYLEVRAYSNATIGEYTVHSDKIAQSDDNYNFKTAVILSLNKDYSDNIGFVGDKDYYKIEIPERQAGTVVDKYSMYATGDFDNYGSLYNSEGQVLATNDDGNGNTNFKIMREDLQPGTYYLEVKGYRDTRVGSYTVRVDREVNRDENYNFETAVSLPLKKDYFEKIDFAGDKDYYKFEMPEHQVGTVVDKYIMYAMGDFDNYGTLYNSEGQVLATNDDGNGNTNFKIIKEELQPGTYYLEVKGYSDTRVGSYTVRVDQEVNRDENYNFETAVNLSLEKSQKDKIGFAGDKDYYKIEVPAAETSINKYILYATGDFDNYGTLYNSEGQILATNDDSDGYGNFKITKELQAGIYYLEVKGYSDTRTGSYAVRIDTEESFKQKTTQIHSTGSYSGTISAAAKETIKLYEFYVWDKPQGTVFREHEFNFTANLFGTMTLLDASQKPIATIDYRGQALSPKIIQALEKGKYYLEIKTQGNYTFSIKEKNISNDSNRSFEEARLLWGKQTINDTIDFGEASKYAGDEDYFKLFIPNYEYGKHTIKLSGNANIVGQLYNDQKELINGDFKHSLTKKLKPGIYYVKVRGENANIRGSYQIGFVGEETFEEAESLALNETIQSDLSAAQGAKYYKFQVANLSQLDFYLANSHATTIEVYDQNYKKLIGKNWESTNHKVSGVFLPGSYYIKIASKSPTKYKLMISEEQRNENRIELVDVGMSKQVYLNGSPSPELTQILNRRFAARSLLLPSDFSIIDFVQGMVTEWTINTGGVPLLDAIFGTDRTSYLQDWRLRSKSYALGMYAGDGISLIQGTVSLVGARIFFIGGNLFGISGTPFTGGASLTLCPVTTAVTVAVAVEASTMVVSAVKNMGEGHRWDPELEGDYYKEGLKEIPDDWIEVEAPEEFKIKSEVFKKFLENRGYKVNNSRKVVEKWASPDGKIYQRNYWTNGKEYFSWFRDRRIFSTLN